MKTLTILDETKTKMSEGPVDFSGFNLQGWNILVQPTKVDEKTKGGIILPDEARDDVAYLNNVALVLAVGPMAYTQEAFKGVAWCKPGDYVLLPKNSGTKILLRGVPVLLIACDRVLAVIDDPATIDPKFNIGVVPNS